MCKPRSPLFHFWLTVAIFLVSILVLAVSCRKTDRVLSTSTTLSETETKFFSNHRSADAREKALVEYLGRQNNSLHFIETTAGRIGYPRWNKAIRFSANSAIQARTESGSNSGTVTYIPFVRQNENYVNAAMAVYTTGTDTSFSYICDWQYADYGFAPQPDSTGAKDIFHLFTRMDNAVFGSTVFKITDHRLLTASEKQRIIEWGKNPDSVNVYYELKNTGNTTTTELLTPVETCTLYDVTVTFNCPSGGGGGGGDCGPCYAFANEATTTEEERCWFTYQYEECITTWIETGGGSGAAGNGSTGTGGSSGSGSGGTPSDCTGLSGRLYDPCGSGWEIIPVDDPPSAEDPCDKVDSLKNDPPFRAAFTNLKNKTSENREYGYKVYDNGGWAFEQGPANGREGITFHFYDSVFFLMHSHFAGALPIFSVADIETIAGLYDKDLIKPDRFFYGLATETGSYVITIENPAQFQAFRNKYIDIENESQEFELKYKLNKIGQWSDNDKNIKEFISLMKNLNTGTGLLKANNDFSQFSKVSVENGQLTLTPCN